MSVGAYLGEVGQQWLLICLKRTLTLLLFEFCGNQLPIMLGYPAIFCSLERNLLAFQFLLLIAEVIILRMLKGDTKLKQENYCLIFSTARTIEFI